jgi:hypothetical protein
MGLLAGVDILHELLDLGKNLKNWSMSHNGTKLPGQPAKAEVQSVTPFHVKFDFEEGGTKHTLEGKRDLIGGHTQAIILDGTSLPVADGKNHIVLKGHAHVPPRLEVRFVIPTAAMADNHFRFDADVV